MSVALRACFVAPILGLLGACSSSGPPPAVEKYLGLEAPQRGFQVRSVGAEIGPGEEVQYCEVAELPGEPKTTYYVDRIELANGASSHHLIIDAALPGTPSETRLAGMAVGDRVECLATQAVFGDGFELVGASQTRYGDVAFPEGVGRIYHGGQRIVFDYHYANTGATSVPARSAVNFHLTDAGKVKHIARVVNFSNYTIDTPPHEKGSFVARCSYGQDVMVSGITRHTHRWGADFTVSFAGGARDGEHIWTSRNFEEDTEHVFDAPLLMKQGEGFLFQCDYDNTESRTLRFGATAADEMCILFSLAWDAGGALELPPQDCDAVLVGADGVAHAVTAKGDLPAPTAEEVSACLSGSTWAGAGCAECACQSCGGIIAGCVSDPDCGPIFACVQRTGCSQSDCPALCGDVIAQHSAGASKILQVGGCVPASCAGTCNGLGGADAGAR